jgi:hypothetical protein
MRHAETLPALRPSGPVWTLVGHDGAGRLRLADLPSDHGPESRRNPNWVDGHLATDITGRPPLCEA